MLSGERTMCPGQCGRLDHQRVLALFIKGTTALQDVPVGGLEGRRNQALTQLSEQGRDCPVAEELPGQGVGLRVVGDA